MDFERGEREKEGRCSTVRNCSAGEMIEERGEG
jgi:hypothetical protein